MFTRKPEFFMRFISVFRVSLRFLGNLFLKQNERSGNYSKCCLCSFLKSLFIQHEKKKVRTPPPPPIYMGVCVICMCIKNKINCHNHFLISKVFFWNAKMQIKGENMCDNYLISGNERWHFIFHFWNKIQNCDLPLFWCQKLFYLYILMLKKSAIELNFLSSFCITDKYVQHRFVS